MLVLTSQPNAPWLPPGGIADVVLASPSEAWPAPAALVRLLLHGPDGRVFTVHRTGGRAGLDLPTTIVADREAPARALGRLTIEVLGSKVTAELLGYVRNTVPPGTVYEWPTPVAHFCVYRTTMTAEPVIEGTWLTRAEAEQQLDDRHWWPLLAADHSARGRSRF